jgi:hypothetical protein
VGCPLCSQHHHLAEQDGDERALADLASQIKEANTARQRDILRATRAQLKLEAALDRKLRRSLRAAKAAVSDAVQAAADSGGLDALRRMRREELSNWLLEAGLGDLVLDLTEAERETLANVEQLLLASSTGFNVAEIEGIGQALADETVEGIIEGVIIPDTQRAVRDALQGADFIADPSTVISALDAALRSAEGRQITEARTAITTFGRQITAVAAVDAGLDHYLYVGPLDGITRGFCKELVGKTFTEQQVAKLNNYQLNPPLVRGGGYNCRHTWAPISEELIESANIERGTDADVRRANSKARGER